MNKWVSDLERNLWNAIDKTVNDKSINKKLVYDSQNLKDAVGKIEEILIYLNDCEHPSYKKKKVNGRPTIITRELIDFVNKYSEMPIRKLAKLYIKTTGKFISPNTILKIRHLESNDIGYRTLRKE